MNNKLLANGLTRVNALLAETKRILKAFLVSSALLILTGPLGFLHSVAVSATDACEGMPSACGSSGDALNDALCEYWESLGCIKQRPGPAAGGGSGSSSASQDPGSSGSQGAGASGLSAVPQESASAVAPGDLGAGVSGAFDLFLEGPSPWEVHMSDGDIREVSEITTDKGALGGTRYVVDVDGKKKKFRNVEKATAYRDEQLALQESQRERRELQREAAAQEAAEAQARAEYDLDPEYLAFEVRMPLAEMREPKESFFTQKDAGGANVDVEAYAREIQTAGYELFRRGYEIVSITPLISGHAGLKHEHDYQAGWGWGYSFTEGVVVLARKDKQATVSLEGGRA